MNKPANSLDSVISEVRGKLPEYLSRHGVELKPNRAFRCFNPDHQDKSPSCGIVPNTRDQVFSCFGCGLTGNIFTACHLIEGRPSAGAAWVKDTLFYLADSFGIARPEDFELTSEQILEMDTKAAYAAASRIIVTGSLPEKVQDAIDNKYAWNVQVRRSLGIGGVVSFKNFVAQLQHHHGFKAEFIESIDLANPLIFRPENLIYTIKDEKGNPVGFSGRSLNYEEDLADYKASVEKAITEFGPESDQVKALSKPRKYVNSSEAKGNSIYHRQQRLFGFNIAKSAGSMIYIFEGYSDVATAHNVGIRNAAGISGTRFSKHHLALIQAAKINHVVFVLDADEAGKKGTDRVFQDLEDELGGHIGFQVEVITMPDGSDDPDSYLRKEGIKAFKNLPRMSMFSWRLERAKTSTEDKMTLVTNMVGLIVNEPSPILRYRMAQDLQQETGVPLDVIWGEVQLTIDSEKSKIQEQRASLTKKYGQRLIESPENASGIIEELSQKMDALDNQLGGYQPAVVRAAVREALANSAKHTELVGLKTGWPIFDTEFQGIPREDSFFSVPGKPNCGKSSFLVNLAWRLLTHNDDVVVVYHTVDDAISAMLARLQASKNLIATNRFASAGAFLTDPAFQKLHAEATEWLNEMVQTERFIPADVSTLPADMVALGSWVKSVRKKFPNNPIVVFGDNFHHYGMPDSIKSEGESLQRAISKYAKSMSVMNHVTTIMTMELPTAALKPGMRPRSGVIKGSSGMSYDVTANIGIYNDLKDLKDAATIYWVDENDSSVVEGPNGELIDKQRKKPVVEVIIDKSKVNSFDGSIYYLMEPDSGNFTECDAAQQALFGKLSAEYATKQEHVAAGKEKWSKPSSGYSSGPPMQMPKIVPPAAHAVGF
jgi:DNA primase